MLSKPKPNPIGVTHALYDLLLTVLGSFLVTTGSTASPLEPHVSSEVVIINHLTISQWSKYSPQCCAD